MTRRFKKVNSSKQSRAVTSPFIPPFIPPSPARRPSTPSLSLLTHTILGVIFCFQVVCAFIIGQYDPSHSNEKLGVLGKHLCSKNIAPGLRGRDIELITRSTFLTWPSSQLVSLLSALSIGPLISFKAKQSIRNLTLPNSLCDPTPSTYINVSMLYGVLVLMFYNMQKDDRYQDYFLLVGLLCGIVAGILLTPSKLNLEMMKDSVPMSITVGLLASRLFHNVY